MRVTHVIGDLNPSSGGPASVVASLAAAQAGRGHDVCVIASMPPQVQTKLRTATADIPDFARVTRLPVEGIGLLHALRGRLPADAADRVAASDVVHLHGVWEPLLLAASKLARRHNRPWIVSPHGMLDVWALARKPAKKQLALRGLGYGRMLRTAAGMQALSSHELNCLTSAAWNRNVFVLPNGVFLSQIEPLPTPGAFRRSQPALGDSPFVLFLARLHPGKGLNLIAEAFARLPTALKDVQWVIAGPDFGAAAQLREQVSQLGISHRAHFIGPIYGPAKFSAYVDASVFALPSEHEGFSMSIVEAMACGTPVVISPECHFQAVDKHGAGVVAERTAEAVAAALERVLSDPASARQMGGRGRELVRSQYTWERIAANLEQIISQTTRPAPTG